MRDRLTSLFDERALQPELLRILDDAGAGFGVAVAALLAALLIGVIHAIGPGHGKVLIGAYLASTRGRARDAVALGGLVAVMHTASVLALGLVLSLTQRLPGFERLEPILVVVSSTAVMLVGLGLVLRVHRRHAGGVHHHPQSDGVAPLSVGGLVALASAGGLLPSPAAFVALASAMAIGRTGFGLLLVAAFGVGIALTLTVLGLAIVGGRTQLSTVGAHRPWVRRVTAVVPIVGSWAVLIGGFVLAVGAASSLML